MIPRPYYLNLLNRYKDLSLVKILVGIRHCGKSTIIEMFYKDLIQSGISKDHIIQRWYTYENFDNGMTDKDMYEDIKKEIKDGKKYYLLLDEEQEVTD